MGPVDHHRGGNLVMAQCGDERRKFPVAVWCLSNQPLTFPRPPAQPGHVGGGAGLVDEYQASRINRGLLVSPFFARRLDVLAILLGGVQRFF